MKSFGKMAPVHRAEPLQMRQTGPVCTCYVENATRDRFRNRVTAVVDCPKHSTPALRALRDAGHAAAKAYGRGMKADRG